MDIVTKETRSKMMASVKPSDTKPELAVRKYLHSQGFRFRIHKKIGRTKPDIVLPKWKTCIFVHGCFWHRHKGCKLASRPKSNMEFWNTKFRQNTRRDCQNICELNDMGWNVGIIWECNVRNRSFADGELPALISRGVNWEL